MRRLALLANLLIVAATAALAQSVVSLPRAKDPLTLVDFSKPEGVSGWTGLKVSAAKLEDAPAMQFTFPKYVKGENEWPAVYITQGTGLAATDWSHYALVAFDVLADRENNGGVALELRPTAGQNGITVHFPVVSKQVNHLEVPLADLAKQLDLTHIEQIVLFTSRPPDAYTLTVANLRLLPGVKLPAATLDLAYPNYRGLLFPTVDRVTVDVQTQLGEYDLTPGQMTLQVKCSGGGKSVELKRALDRGTQAALSTATLPPGAVQASATVTGPKGEKLAATEWTLRKLSPAEAKALTVYVDENNNTIVDGKPFFPLGWYGGHTMSQMLEIADSPFNCVLDYGTNSLSKAEMLKYLDAVQAHGLKQIYCLNDVYPAARYFDKKTWEGISGNQNIADAVVKAYRDHPALLAWYLNDELPRTMAPELTEYYQKIRDGDANHPCYIVIASMPEVKYFPQTTDIMGVDPYPIPRTAVTMVSEYTDDAVAAVKGHRPVWIVPQAFAWYQYEPEGSSRGRMPTEADLKTGRAPTYEEERCMTYLALVHGAKGLVYYCYYDLRLLPQYQEMWGWMKQIGAEVKELTPLWLSAQKAGQAHFEPATAPIQSLLKRANGREYLVAVNTGETPCEVTFDLRHKLPQEVKVLFENALAKPVGQKLTVSFKPLEVHVYDLGEVK